MARESQPAGVGYTYSDGEFKPPELTKEELQLQKQQMKRQSCYLYGRNIELF